MVIKDQDELLRIEKPTTENWQSAGVQIQTAAPLDRLAANVIDYAIVLLPFIYLILAPFQRALKDSALFGSDFTSSWQMTVITVLASVTVVLIIIAYQTIMVRIWGATIGKMLLGLRVRTIWDGGGPNFAQSASRAVCWCLGWIALGVPFLAVFSNVLRRPFHDRVADTIVTCVRQERKVSRPSLHEAAIVSGVYWAFGLLGLLVLSAFAVSNFKSSTAQDELISELESQNVLCEAISDAQAEWPSENGAKPRRLSVAMSLYAAGSIDRQCLQAEVENLHTPNEKSPLLFLVKSFVYADSSDLSDRYLEKVCDMAPKSLECHMSHLIDHVSQDDWTSAKENLAQMSRSTAVYPYIWAVREFVKHNDFDSAWTYLQKIPNVKQLNDFVTPLRVKVLWALNRRDEARGVEAAAYSSVGIEAKLDVSAFMCFENIWQSCDGLRSQGCQTFSKITTDYDDALSSLQASIAYLRKFECDEKQKGIQKVDYDALLDKPLNDEVKTLAVALDEPGTHKLAKLFDDSTIDGDLAAEVSRRLVQRVHDVHILKELYKDWKSEPPSLAWQKVGAQLFEKLYDLHEYALSAEVMQASQMRSRIHNKVQVKDWVVALTRSNQLHEARKVLEAYLREYPAPDILTSSPAARLPASESDFLEAVRKLKAMR